MHARLRRLTVLMRGLVWLGIVLLLSLPTLSWLEPSLMPGGGHARAGLTWGTRLTGWMLVLPPFVILAAGLAQLGVFCRRIGGPRLFSDAAATALHRFGLALMAASLALPVSRLAVSAMLEGGSFDLRSMTGTPVLLGLALGLLFGVVFVVFAALLREASRLADENERFI